MFKYLLFLIYVLPMACGDDGGTESSELISVASVSGQVEIDGEQEQIRVLSETASDVAEDLFLCQITLDQGEIINYRILSDNSLSLNGEAVERVLGYSGNDSASGVDDRIFGTWRFPEEEIQGVRFIIELTIEPSRLVYTNTCRR